MYCFIQSLQVRSLSMHATGPCSNGFLALILSLTVGLLILLSLFSDVREKLNQNKYLVNITVTHEQCGRFSQVHVLSLNVPMFHH